MKKRLRILSADVDAAEKKLCFNLEIDGRPEILWYKTTDEYAEYFCSELCDGVVISFIPFAIRNKMDIECDIPITDQLYFKITKNLIPALKLRNPEIDLQIIATPICVKQNNNAVATGMSCGIDSFATLYEYSGENCPNEYRINLLTYFNVGAHHGQIDYDNGHVSHELFLEEMENTKRFCKEYNYPLLVVDTNVAAIQKMNFVPTHSYRNIGTAVIFQKLIKTYLYSSGITVDYFKVDINDAAGYYDILSLENFSSSNIRIMSSHPASTRIEKTESVAQFPPSYNSLSVCLNSSKNCGLCHKCERTLATLYALGCLDKFKNSFDIDAFLKNKHKWQAELLAKRNDKYCLEIRRLFKKNNIKFSVRARIYVIPFFISALMERAVKKIKWELSKRR